jgi:glutathione S-transferase
MRTPVAMTAPNKSLMRDNPLSKIPTLITDDGMVLFDSLLICEYLDSLHAGPKLFPPDGAERWQALRWQALGNGMLDAEILWRNELIRPEPKQSREILDAFDIKVRTALALLDREAKTIAAAPFSIGHVSVGCALGYLDFRFSTFAWRDGNPIIASWFAELEKRASLQLTTAVDE